MDKRNIATGGASDYEFVIHYPRPNLADSYGQSQWMPILLTQLLADLCKPKHILAISGGLDTYKLKPFQDIYDSKIYMLNNNCQVKNVTIIKPYFIYIKNATSICLIIIIKWEFYK